MNADGTFDRIVATSGYLEVINGTWAILNLCVVVIFAAYIIHEVRRVGWWRGYWALSAAVAILVSNLGEGLFRGWVWTWRHQINHGIDAAWMSVHPIVVIFAALAMIGSLCKIRVFAPAWIGHWGWIGSALIAVLAAIAAVAVSGG